MASLHRETETRAGADRYALRGLSLPRSVLHALEKRGIYCLPTISLEYQHLANRYVLRAVESGGGVSDIGRACAFVASDGCPLPWLQRIDSIGVNGRHAIYLAETLVRLEMLRVGRTCELAVTSHSLLSVPGRTRPVIRSAMIFRGRDGTLPVDLWKQEHEALRGNLAPVFYSRSGEVLKLPEPFELAIKKVTACVSCIGCRHSHVGRLPSATGEQS
jgi:hypothetical protein